jgi:hypothetical protein
VRSLADIEARLDALEAQGPGPGDAAEMLGLGEEVLEHWVRARGEEPTGELREGFRLLALHRQGCKDLPSFNACRETCRELVYHYNLLGPGGGDEAAGRHARMMLLVARHLYLFVSGKMQVEQLGEFCCSSRPLRQEAG